MFTVNFDAISNTFLTSTSYALLALLAAWTASGRSQ